MRALALVAALSLGGCEWLIGIEDPVPPQDASVGSDAGLLARCDQATDGGLRCPEGMAGIALGGGCFCIDRWEASTNADDVAVSAANVEPATYIDLAQAMTACGKAGKRLCSASEWLHACKGNDERTYPYGDVYQPGACNVSPGALSDTGAFKRCEGATGAVFDLVGNLAEWTLDEAASPDAGSPNVDGTARGGSHATSSYQASCGVSDTQGPATQSPYIGFRCCKSLD